MYAATDTITYGSPRGLTASAASLSAFAMWMVMASGAVVLMEPAPYDVFLCGLMLLLPAMGATRLSTSLLLHAAVWTLIAAGGFIAGIAADSYVVPAKHTAISLFLTAGAVLVGAYVARDPQRNGSAVLSGMTAGGIFTAAAGLLGYFSLIPGAWDLFTEFGRARAAFKDPNVYGPFMVPGLLWCLHLILHGGWKSRTAAAAITPLLMAGLLVSFSRGAWLNMAAAIATYGCLAFVVANTNRMRVRLAGVVLSGLIVCALLLTAILQVPEVLDFLKERAALLQDYDVGPEGRFAGQVKAFELITQNPLGIGALEFSRNHHPEDVHNVYLSMFLNAGWMGGFLYAAAVVVTLLAGLRLTLISRAIQGPLAVAIAAFAGLAVEGLVIDSDHWRHFYAILGLVWGLMAAAPSGRPPQGAGRIYRQKL